MLHMLMYIFGIASLLVFYCVLMLCRWMEPLLFVYYLMQFFVTVMCNGMCYIEFHVVLVRVNGNKCCTYVR
jgi:hypothetical protein